MVTKVRMSLIKSCLFKQMITYSREIMLNRSGAEVGRGEDS